MGWLSCEEKLKTLEYGLENKYQDDQWTLAYKWRKEKGKEIGKVVQVFPRIEKSGNNS